MMPNSTLHNLTDIKLPNIDETNDINPTTTTFTKNKKACSTNKVRLAFRGTH
jgi:hypothetical protein